MNAPNPYAPPSAPVRDLPSGDSQFELAGRGTRLGAAIIDGLIVGCVVYVPLFIGMQGPMPVTTNTFEVYEAMLSSRGAPIAGLGFLVWAAITWYLVHRNGQTMGKKLLGIRVVRTDGSRASVARIFWLRNVIMTLISIIPIAGTLAALINVLLIFRESRQCLHDQIAGTIVVKA
jgi:uncharacterized RDD family membrane protein YckC